MSHSIYPKRCVPQKDYKLIKQESIELMRHKYVIRYSEHDVPIRNREELDLNLKTNMASSKFTTGLSVTLIGVSKKTDAGYLLKGGRKDALSSDWKPDGVVLRVHQEDFHYKRNRGFYGLLIDSILGCQIEMDVFEKDVRIRTDVVKYEMVHKPTHSNYWHFCIFPYAVNSSTGELYYLRDGLPSKMGAKNATRNIAERLKTYTVLADNVVERPIKASHYLDIE